MQTDYACTICGEKSPCRCYRDMVRKLDETPVPQWPTTPQPAPPHKTDIDIPPMHRTHANFWEARYWQARHELVKANAALVRLSAQNKRLRKRLPASAPDSDPDSREGLK